MDIEYASDDSDSRTVIPSIKDPLLVRPAVLKPSSCLPAVISRGPQGGKPSPDAFIIGDDTIDAAPADFLADAEDDKDDFESWEPVSDAAGYQTATPGYVYWNNNGTFAHRYLTVLGGGPVPAPQISPAYRRYEAHLHETLSCVDETSHVSQKHHMLIQRAFALPGFRIQPTSRQTYVNEEGRCHPFDVLIPYEHRRLWVSPLATNAAVAAAEPIPQTVVMVQLVRTFQVAVDLHKRGIYSVHSRAFARLVSHRLKQVDPAFRDFNVTSDIKFVLDRFTWCRRLYQCMGPLCALNMWGNISTVSVIAFGLHGVVDEFRKPVYAEERDAIDNVVVDPAVERLHCPRRILRRRPPHSRHAATDHRLLRISDSEF